MNASLPKIEILNLGTEPFDEFFTSAANTPDLQDRMLVVCNVRVDTVVSSTPGTHPTLCHAKTSQMLVSNDYGMKQTWHTA